MIWRFMKKYVNNVGIVIIPAKCLDTVTNKVPTFTETMLILINYEEENL